MHESIAAYVDRALAQAPPLTDEQVADIVARLRSADADEQEAAANA
jgi:hypothetical protein